MHLEAHAGVGAVLFTLLADATPPRSAHGWVFGIDYALLILGSLVILIALTRWARRGFPDPLRDGPARPHRMPPDAILFPFLAWLATAMLIMALGRSLGAGADDKRVNLLANNISQIAGALACLMVAQRWFEGGARTFVRGPPRCSALRLVSTAILFWLVSLPLGEVLLKSVQHIFTRLWPDYVFPQHVVVEALLGGAEPLWFVVLLWLGAAVIAPIAEEIFFRGILQTAIVDLSSRALFPARARASRWVGVIVAGVAFGLSHMAQWHAVPALALFGILLGVAYERTGSLVPPILMHALFNLTTLVSVALGRAGE